MSSALQYISFGDLELYFVDKDSGLPLSAGKINFYSDINRSTPKSVFSLSGSPPNYSYVDIGSQFILSGSGTFQDLDGNNIIPYGYPYDANGNVELYYITVFSSTDVPQFTREAQPPGVTATNPEEEGLDIQNFIPNGQFLLHNNIPANILTNAPAGKITSSYTQIAAGGWSFERPLGSSSEDNVTFFRYPSYVPNPSASPRYAVRVNCSAPNPADSFKYLGIRFSDVNKFASTTQEYTFSFSGITDNSVDFPVTIYLLKYFGTGGSPTVTTSIGTFNFSSVNQISSSAFIFGTNVGKNIGVNNDDYVQIVIGFPTAFGFTGVLTDFSLVIGNINIQGFPISTNRDFITRTLTTDTPDPNGYNLGLPLILTKDGLSFDLSQIGKIFPTILYYPGYGELPCDGSVYRTDDYSSDGIPYARLYKNLTDTPVVPGSLGNLGIAMFGTGKTYVTASQVDTGIGFISTNQTGPQTATADGAVPTGFTFTTVCTGQASPSTLGFSSWTYGTGGKTWYLCNSSGYVTPGTTSSSGCPQITVNSSPNPSQGEIVGSSVAQQLMSISATGAPAASTFIQVANPSQQFKIWFTLNGVGTVPGGSGTPIRVNMLTNMGPTDTTYVLGQVLSGFQLSTFTTVAGNLIPPSSYFTFYANGQAYVVWYNLNGAGVSPSAGTAILISVTYNTSQTANVILLNTLKAINRMYFATPDLRGWVIKGWSNQGADDINIAYRFSRNGTRYDHPQIGLTSYIGSYQKDVLLDHTHVTQQYSNLPPSPATDREIDFNSAADWTYTKLPLTTTDNAYHLMVETGTGQNDTKNVYLNYVIKY